MMNFSLTYIHHSLKLLGALIYPQVPLFWSFLCKVMLARRGLNHPASRLRTRNVFSKFPHDWYSAGNAREKRKIKASSQTHWPCQQIRCCTSTTYCVQSRNTKKIRFNLNSLNIFTKGTCETASNKVKLAKVGSNAIVPVPGGGEEGPQKGRKSTDFQHAHLLCMKKCVLVYSKVYKKFSSLFFTSKYTRKFLVGLYSLENGACYGSQ